MFSCVHACVKKELFTEHLLKITEQIFFELQQ